MKAASEVLARKYRPSNFDELIGNMEIELEKLVLEEQKQKDLKDKQLKAIGTIKKFLKSLPRKREREERELMQGEDKPAPGVSSHDTNIEEWRRGIPAGNQLGNIINEMNERMLAGEYAVGAIDARTKRERKKDPPVDYTKEELG